mgnify:CR=1
MIGFYYATRLAKGQVAWEGRPGPAQGLLAALVGLSAGGASAASVQL